MIKGGGHMLGNIAPFTPALSRREKDRYSAFYCGLCKTLGKRYGVFSRFLLSYDMAFTAMVYDGINGDMMFICVCIAITAPMNSDMVTTIAIESIPSL